MRFTLDELVRATRARVVRWPGQAAVQPTHDLEQVGPGALFVPMDWLPGPRVLSRLADLKAAAVVTYPGDRLDWLERYPELGVVVVANPPEAYCSLAEEARWRTAGLVVGITGSSGKSSTRWFLAELLRQRFRVWTNRNNLNRWSDCAGILLAMAGEPTEAAVIEMGFGQAGDIERMAALARPHHGIITKVTVDHLDGGGSVADVAREKGRLGAHVCCDGWMVMHGEDPGSGLIDRSQFSARLRTFGEKPAADVRYSQVRFDERGTTFALSLPGYADQLACRIQAVGVHQVANAAAAATVAAAAGLTAAEIQQGLARTAPAPRRFAVHRYSRGLTVIDDSFSSSVDAMRVGLATAAALAGSRRRVAVVSGIAQLEAQTATWHRTVGRWLVEHGFQAVLLVLPDERTAAIQMGAAAAGFQGEFAAVSDLHRLPEELLRVSQPDTLIYCKTSQFIWSGPALDAFRAELPAAGFAPLDGA